MTDMDELSESEMEENWTDTTCAAPTDNVPSGTDVAKFNKTDATDSSNQGDPDTNTAQQTAETELSTTTDAASEQQLVSRIALNDNKAGMQGLDKDRINQIIYEASKGSRYYQNELRKEKQTNAKIEEQKRRIAELDENLIKQGETEADKVLQEAEESRDLTHTIMHIDMDAFYAAVEMRDNPELKHKPMAVGGSSMLSTSNYLARRYGVRAAMPGFIGKKLCPDLVIVPTNFAKYTEVSNQVRDILREYDPKFCAVSLDEAYLDLTKHVEKRKNMSEEERTFYQVRTPATQRPDESPEDVDDTAASSRAGDASFALLDTDTELTGMLDNTATTQISDEETGDENMRTKSTEDISKDRSETAESFSVDSEVLQTTMDDSAEVDSIDVTTEAMPTDEDSQARMSLEQKSEDPDGGGKEREPETDEPAAKDLDVVDETQSQKERQRVAVTFGVSAVETVREIRFRIEQKTGLTASAGIAPNMMLAKVCSDMNKPNGQYYIPPNRAAVVNFINTLPIRKISGIGKVQEKMLAAVGVQVCADLHKKRGLLYHLYSTVTFNHFMRISLAIGSIAMGKDERKSFSTEQTFSEMSAPVEMYQKLYELCDIVCKDLKNEQLMGKTVTVKMKTVEFELKTRGKSLNNPTNQHTAIYAAAREILKTQIEESKPPQELKLRLMGVRVHNLSKEEKNVKKQSTITEMFLQKKLGSPRKHKLPVDSDDSDEIPAKRRRLDVTEESRPLSEVSFDSEATDIYCTTSNGSEQTEESDAGGSKRAESRTSEDSIATAALAATASASHDSLGTKARDTPVTAALIKAQGSEPISCPVCAREFKSRNTTHITRHIERCLDATWEASTATATESAEHDKDDAEHLFEDDSDDFFSSRESQMVLSQEAKKIEECGEVEVGTNGTNVNDEAEDIEAEDVEKIEDDRTETPDDEDDDRQETPDGETSNIHTQQIEETILEDENTVEESSAAAAADDREAAGCEPLNEDVESAEEKPRDEDNFQDAVKVGEHQEGETDSGNNDREIEGVQNGLEVPPPTDMLCPVCNIVQLVDIKLFNLHVDRCLKKQEEDVAVAQKPTGLLGYLKGATTRRPLRADGGASITGNAKSRPTSRGRASAKSVRDKIRYEPLKTTVSRRQTHTSVTKLTDPSSQADDDSDSDSDTEMVCPVCNAALYNVSLMVFNQHVDTCLNRQTIRQLIHEQDGEGAKRSEESDAPKKRKLSGLEQMSNPMKKIYSFFKKS